MANSISTVSVMIRAVTGPLKTGLMKASKMMTVFGAKARAIGSSISMNIGMPLALIGGAAVKAAMDFQSSMVKIQTLVGESKESVEQLNEVVLGLSRETAQSPQELAEAMFFLKSAQLGNKDAAEALHAAAMGSAIGLGETKDIALVSAAVMNTYGSETYSAAQATDILAATVRKGMLEAEELAPQMGELLGLAETLGISFEELGANISTYTLTGVNASTATTGLKGVMAALAKGVPAADAELKKYNLSWDILRKEVQEKGLLETLAMMKDRIGDNAAAYSKIFGRVQGLTNVLNVSGKQLEQYRENLDEITNSAGLTAEGFALVQQTADFKFKKALNGIRVAGVRLGAMLLPVVEKIALVIENLITKWDGLSASTKKWAIAIGGVLILIGPLIALIGFLGKVVGLIISPIGAIIVGLGALGLAIYKNWDTVKKWIVAIVNYFVEMYNESMFFRSSIHFVILAVQTLFETFKFFFGAIWDVLVTFANSAGTLLSGVGDMIKGIFTLSWDDIKQGFTKITKTMGDNMVKNLKSVADRATTFGKNTSENWKKSIEGSREGNLKFITEDDIDNQMANVKDWFGDKWASVKEFIMGNLNEGFEMPELDNTPPGGDLPGTDPEGSDPSGDGGGGGSGAAKEDNRSWLRKVLEDKSQMWKDYFAKQDTQWNSWGEKTAGVMEEVAAVASEITSGMSEISNLAHNKKMTEIQNEKHAEIEALKQMGLSEEEFSKKKKDIDKKYTAMENAEKRKKAKRDKAIAVMNAIIGTAQAVANALPIIPLAIAVGAMGAAQVGLIMSTPIPAMAKGGLAYGPTMAMVGDNPNAGVDPEVVAPLSKLKSMMFGGMGSTGGRLEIAGEFKGDDVWLTQEKTDINRKRYI